MSNEKHILRCGDEVQFMPTGELWLVAYADYETGKMSWYGWPEGVADIADCKLVKAASDDEHLRCVSEWCDRPAGNDHRFSAVRRIYRHQNDSVKAESQCDLPRIMELIGAYLAPSGPISYGKLVELLRQTKGCESYRTSDLYPRLFNLKAVPAEEDPMFLSYDCEAAAAALLQKLEGN